MLSERGVEEMGEVMENKTELAVGEVIKNASGPCTYSFYRQGHLYYNISVLDETAEYDRFGVRAVKYVFPVNVKDLDGATVNREEKPILMMRYITKAMDAGSFVLAG